MYYLQILQWEKINGYDYDYDYDYIIDFQTNIFYLVRKCLHVVPGLAGYKIIKALKR
jgi:hypothetical protein